MLSYKLAKQLKDAGFLQEGDGIDSEILDSSMTSTTSIFRENVYIPTLSELIEACTVKAKHFILTVRHDGWIALDGIFQNGLTDGVLFKNLDGKTPEEAVAKLWLELNKEE